MQKALEDLAQAIKETAFIKSLVKMMDRLAGTSRG